MAYRLVRSSNLSDPPVNCKILLSQAKEVFQAGDKVEGTLVVSHQRDLILRGFKVVLEGTSLTKFKEHDIFHSKSEEFLMEHHYVFGQEWQKNRLGGGTISKTHKFPFSLQIPSETLPGSFKSSFGLTVYQIVAYMHMEPLRFVKKAEKTITVNSSLALTESNTAINPTSFEKSIRKLKFKISSPQIGYLSGEQIPFKVELENPSGYDISNIVVSLVQKTIYRAGNVSRFSKITSTILTSVETKQLEQLNTIWTNELQIPPRQRPTQQNGIIEIQYVMKIEINTNGNAPGLRGEFGIIIGTTRTELAETSTKESPSFVNDAGSGTGMETEADKNQNNSSQESSNDIPSSDSGKDCPSTFSVLSLSRSSLGACTAVLLFEKNDNNNSY